MDRRSYKQGKISSQGKYKSKSKGNEVQKQIKTVLAQSVERKFIETRLDISTPDLTGILQQLNTIPQGSTVSTRVGDSLVLKSLVWRARLQYIEGSGDGVGTYRFIIFQWLPNSLPTTAQILETVGTDAVFLNHFNHANRKQFKVLFDSNCGYVVGPQLGAGTTYKTATHLQATYPLSVINYFPLNNLEYTAASSTDSTGRLYIAMFADAGSLVSWKFDIRTNYTDM